MSEDTTTTTDLTSQYAAQVTNDLEANAKEQERINAEIAALQEQLTALQHDHSVLVNVRQVLGIAPAPAQPAATPSSAAVPAPRKKASAEPGAGKRTRAKKATGSQGATTGKKSAAKKPTDKAAASKAGRPTLVELVRSHLTEQSEPRSAAEVTSALGQAHPERGIKATVVALDGAVETACRLGVADAVCDVVETGTTLRAAGLQVIGEPVLRSEAVLVRREGAEEIPAVAQLRRRLRGVLVAQQYVLVDYDCPNELLERATAITPGLEGPTVSPLQTPGWSAVRRIPLCTRTICRR